MTQVVLITSLKTIGRGLSIREVLGGERIDRYVEFREGGGNLLLIACTSIRWKEKVLLCVCVCV